MTLERMLGDESIAAQALEAALDDIWRHAGAHRAMGINAEDWLFGRLRQVAQLYRSGSPGSAHLRPVPSVDAPTHVAMPPEASPIETAYPAGEADLGSPELVNSRIRRPSAPIQSQPIARAPDARAEHPRRRVWLRLVVLWLLACALGFALATVGLLWLTGTSPFSVSVERIVPSPPTARTAPPLAEPGPSRPSARDLLGAPLAAPEPPTDVAPESLSVAPPQATQSTTAPAPPIPVASARIAIHFGGDAESREVAQRLADQLRRADYGSVELKGVPFEIGSASVRFFHAEDRLAAEQLVNALGPFLVWQGRAAPTAPIDFTDYRPLPSPGSLEIWLPRR